MIDNDKMPLEDEILQKEKIIYVLKNYKELTQKYKRKGFISAVICLTILGSLIYILSNTFNIETYGMMSFELCVSLLAILNGIKVANDNEYYKIKKEYNLKEVEQELDNLKKELQEKRNLIVDKENNLDKEDKFYNEQLYQVNNYNKENGLLRKRIK